MAKPKLALIPAAQGTKLYSVLPSDGVGDFDFTRGSVATRINAQGLIENVASGVSRLNYPMIDGVQKGCPHHILEPARTNSIPYSEDFSNAAWIKQTNITVLDNQIISPDGTLNADKITTTSNSNFIYDVLSLTPSTEYTVSFYIKNDNAIITRFWGSGEVSVDISWDGKSVQDISSGSYEYFGNDWYKITVTQQTASDGTYIVRIYPNETETTTNSVYIWGWQVEEGSYPTSYIPTSGTAVTRSAETATGSGSAATFNSEQGVLMAEISALSDDSTNRQMTLSDGTNDNRLVLKYDNQSNIIQSFNRVGGVESAFLSASITDITLFSKCLVKYKVNDYQLWINGFKLDTDISASVWSSSTLNDLKINAGGGADFYGNIKQLQYFDTSLTDSDLETLTSWVSFQDMAEGQLYTIE